MIYLSDLLIGDNGDSLNITVLLIFGKMPFSYKKSFWPLLRFIIKIVMCKYIHNVHSSIYITIHRWFNRLFIFNYLSFIFIFSYNINYLRTSSIIVLFSVPFCFYALIYVSFFLKIVHTHYVTRRRLMAKTRIMTHNRFDSGVFSRMGAKASKLKLFS